jgi:hypothetical protein
MTDNVLMAFLQGQREACTALAASSDLVTLTPLGASPVHRYLAEFRCKGLVRVDGEIVETNRFLVGIRFPAHYLRGFNPAEVLTWLEPANVWHPNIRPPFICVGHLTPGTSLQSLVYQVYEMITYQRVTMREDDALNPAACVWARRHQPRFPIDRRPLKRRALAIEIDPRPGEPRP